MEREEVLDGLLLDVGELFFVVAVESLVLDREVGIIISIIQAAPHLLAMVLRRSGQMCSSHLHRIPILPLEGLLGTLLLLVNQQHR